MENKKTFATSQESSAYEEAERAVNLQTIKAYNAVYAGIVNSQTFKNIILDVFGGDFPERTRPTNSITEIHLDDLIKYLGISKGETLVDLGCGRGILGLRIAEKTGANLTGIGFSPASIQQAMQRINEFDLKGLVRFYTADITSTGLDDSSCDAVMCLDMLGMGANKIPALNEILRILKPSGRFVYTTWEKPDVPFEMESQLLEETGFKAETYYAIKDNDLFRLFNENIIDKRSVLIKEMGEQAVESILSVAEDSLNSLRNKEYILIGCKKNHQDNL
ncbi:MAG: class I SAM-dependent methyltransferase [Spirochaetales bacterium]|nr:class I SAM-dependent methyltransferase [Spirochaetales bacterium]